MYIVTCEELYHEGNTVEEAIASFEHCFGETNWQEFKVYEAKEVKVQRKFEVVKED